MTIESIIEIGRDAPTKNLKIIYYMYGLLKKLGS